MVDLIPEGSISLRSAYKRFFRALWGDDPPLTTFRHEQMFASVHPDIAQRCRSRLANVRTQLLSELVTAFSNESLVAYVRQPGSSENFVIPAECWEVPLFPEQIVYGAEIKESHGGYWDELIGRTPLVKLTQFDQWLTVQVERRADPQAAPSPANQALREHLLGLALDGVLPSTEIENLAQEWGLPPFEYSPPLGTYDALKLPRWTLCMAVSWIVWRTPEDVREGIDRYRTGCWRWVPCRRHVPIGSDWCEVNGQEMVTLQALSITRLGMAEAADLEDREASKRMSIKSAREELWQHLGQEEFSATGLDANGRIAVIPAYEWGYLQLAGRRSYADCLVFAHDPFVKAYSDVTVPSTAVRDRWRGLCEPPAENEQEKNALPATPLKRGKVVATRLALNELYPNGPPIGLSVKERLDAVNNWHRRNGNSQVSLTTVLRATRS